MNPNNRKKHKPIKIRKDWGDISPVTKIKNSDKIYKRKKYTPQELHELFDVE